MNQVIDNETYHVMLCFLDNLHFIEKPAGEEDMLFLKNDWWLADTAVIDTINFKRGGWEVFLTFANYKKPLQLIVRLIVRCFSEEKARTSAYYIRKQAAKDQRGTLFVALRDLHLCIN